MVGDIHLGDVVTLKKVHPCGSYQWEVLRLGADIRIKCLGCSRVVMLPRSVIERRIKSIVHAPSDT